MPFDNASGEPAWEWVRFGLRSLVTEALPQGAVEVIGLDVTRALGEGDDPVRLAQRGGAHLVLQVVFDRTVDGVVLATRLTWPNGREMRREIRSSDAGSAARALSDLLAERLDPGAAVVEAHSGDPFVDRLYAMAVGDLVRGDDPEGAAVLLTRCLELDPGFHRARLQRASAALQVTEWEKAEADLDRVEEEIEPRESILGPWLFDLRAQLLNRRGELDEARAVILEALARIDEGRWPQSARPSLEVELAELALHADEPLEAERWLRRAEEAYRGPDARVERVGVLLRLGVVLERLQRYDEALEILAETEEMARELELPRRLGQVWNSRGGVLRRTGDVEGALAAFEKAEIIARDTDNLELAQALRTNRALVLVEEGRLDEGYDLLLASLAETEAIGQRHNVALVRFNLAYVALLLERPTEARRHLEVAADFYGEAWDVLYLEGWIELLEGRADVALGTLRRARSEAGDLWGEGEEAILEEARLAAG